MQEDRIMQWALLRKVCTFGARFVGIPCARRSDRTTRPIACSMLRLSRTDASEKTSIFEVNGAGPVGLQDVGHSVQIQLSRLFRKIKSRRRLR
jgi:ABC-type taurine transport system ATPase subunit